MASVFSAIPRIFSTEEYQAVRTFLLRASSLPPGPRSALALQLANPLAARLRPPPPGGVSPELYLHCVAAAYQQRQRLAATPGAAAPAPPAAPAEPVAQDRVGEGARPSPVEQGGFAPPG